ncbi:hypothetical protein KEM56_002875 [Ascosphaera pollenicola]|nr:hypothetical protein KEM56_002875 [Ascosphaera pollenicola]
MITIKEKDLGIMELEFEREIDRQAEQRDARNADKSLTALMCLMGLHGVALIIVGFMGSARKRSLAKDTTEQQPKERATTIECVALGMFAVTIIFAYVTLRYLLILCPHPILEKASHTDTAVTTRSVIGYRESKAKKRFQARRERALLRGDDYKKGYGPVACKGCAKTVRIVDDVHSLLWQLRHVMPIDDSRESGIRLAKYLDGRNLDGFDDSLL